MSKYEKRKGNVLASAVNIVRRGEDVVDVSAAADAEAVENYKRYHIVSDLLVTAGEIHVDGDGQVDSLDGWVDWALELRCFDNDPDRIAAFKDVLAPHFLSVPDGKIGRNLFIKTCANVALMVMNSDNYDRYV